jgi:hypothetical protein
MFGSLNEANLASIVHELELLFTKASRHDMSQLLTDFVMDACVRSGIPPPAPQHTLSLWG